jgi:hypothetical protein
MDDDQAGDWYVRLALRVPSDRNVIDLDVYPRTEFDAVEAALRLWDRFMSAPDFDPRRRQDSDRPFEPVVEVRRGDGAWHPVDPAWRLHVRPWSRDERERALREREREAHAAPPPSVPGADHDEATCELCRLHREWVADGWDPDRPEEPSERARGVIGLGTPQPDSGYLFWAETVAEHGRLVASRRVGDDDAPDPRE